MVGALLNWPQATFASKVVVDKQAGRALVTREVTPPPPSPPRGQPLRLFSSPPH